MAPAPHSCPHCLGQGEKRLLFREAKAELTLVNHASSHARSSPLRGRRVGVVVEEEEEEFSLGPLWLQQGGGGLAAPALRISGSFSSEAVLKREAMEGRKAAHPSIHPSSAYPALRLPGVLELIPAPPQGENWGQSFQPCTSCQFFVHKTNHRPPARLCLCGRKLQYLKKKNKVPALPQPLGRNPNWRLRRPPAGAASL